MANLRGGSSVGGVPISALASQSSGGSEDVYRQTVSEAIRVESIDWAYQNTENVGALLNSVYGEEVFPLPIFGNLKTWDAIKTNSTAMSTLAGNIVAMQAVNMSNVAREAFFSAPFSVGKGIDTLVVSGGGVTNSTLTSRTTISAVASSSTSMNALLLSSVAITAIAKSSNAMTAMVASSTAMIRIADSSLAMGIITSLPQAMTVLVSTATGRDYFFNSNYMVGNGLNTLAKLDGAGHNSTLAGTATMSLVVASTVTSASIAASARAMDAISISTVARGKVGYSGAGYNAIKAVNMAISKYTMGHAGIDPALYSDIAVIAENTTDMNTIVGSSAAMDALFNSAVGMNIIAASANGMNIISASSSARTKIGSSGVAFDSIKAVEQGITKYIVGCAGLAPSSYYNLAGLTAHPAAMTSVAASSAAVNAIVGITSSTFRDTFINTATSMSALAANSTAMNIISSASAWQNAFITRAAAFNIIMKSAAARVAMGANAQDFLTTNSSAIRTLLGNATYFTLVGTGLTIGNATGILTTGDGNSCVILTAYDDYADDNGYINWVRNPADVQVLNGTSVTNEAHGSLNIPILGYAQADVIFIADQVYVTYDKWQAV